MTEKQLVDCIDRLFTSKLFVKKSLSWYLDEGLLIKVVNLQKSKHTHSYYVNISIFFKEFGEDKKFPREDECHIRTRVNSEIAEVSIDYNHLFNLEENTLDSDFEEKLSKCVDTNILPQLDLIKSRNGLIVISKRIPFFLNTIPLKVKEYLKI